MLSRGSTFRRLLPLGLGVLCAVAGCQAPAQPTGRTSMVLRVADYDRFWGESLSMLRRYDFAPEFVDRAQGLAVSQPATSGQFFEFWRVDSRGAYNIAESSMHTMRRIVTLQVEPLDGLIPPPADEPVELAAGESPATQPTSPQLAQTGPPPRYRVVVRADKSRYSAPERQVTTASGALGIFSERLPTAEGLMPHGYVVQWVPLGRDGLLESFLLDEIARVNPAAERVDDPAAWAAPPIAQAR
jgi:hypothetical protein